MRNKFIIFAVALLACIFVLGSNVHAFTNSTYYDNQEIKIGLESMANSQLTITLNGDYTLNGVTRNSGTSYILKINGAQIDLNGTLYSNITFIPKNTSSTIKIGSNNYLGIMNFNIDSSSGTSKIMPINTLYIENYLKGVVGYEMSDYFPVEALKAQAVAARNYTLASINKHTTKGYNLCDTIHCQVYRGYQTSFTRVIAAVDATKGMMLLSGTSIVAAYYSASDGGYTEASGNVWVQDITYLKAKADSYDGYDAGYLWNITHTNDNISQALLKLSPNDTFVKIDTNTITKYESGRIKNITLIFKNIYGIEYTKSYSKEAARTFLGFKSSMYDVSYNVTGSYTFDGKGWGHGVGMSQIGARNRANAGHSFDNILKFYYDGTTIINALPSISNISVDKAKIYSFDYPSFSVNASGGSGTGLTYNYVIEKNSTILYQSGFVNSSKFQYKPREAGSYNLIVYVKDIASILPFEDTKTYSFNVEVSAQEDVNLDKIVDIYDYVMVSKNMGKRRGVSTDWNERWNVEDSDDVINILDLTKITKKYNYKY